MVRARLSGVQTCKALSGALSVLEPTRVFSSTFSKQALDYAKGLQQRVILIDGERLTELMVEFGVGVRTNREIEIKRLDEDFFSDDA